GRAGRRARRPRPSGRSRRARRDRRSGDARRCRRARAAPGTSCALELLRKPRQRRHGVVDLPAVLRREPSERRAERDRALVAPGVDPAPDVRRELEPRDPPVVLVDVPLGGGRDRRARLTPHDAQQLGLRGRQLPERIARVPAQRAAHRPHRRQQILAGRHLSHITSVSEVFRLYPSANSVTVATVAVARCTFLVLLALVLAAPAAASNPRIQAQRERAHRVEAHVNTMGVQLEGVIQRWDGERDALARVNARLRTANAQLEIAQTNLHAANTRLLQRLKALYVDPPPNAMDVFLGAKSLSDLINRVEATQTFSQQDKALAATALQFRTEVAQRKAELTRERRNRTRLIAQLAAQRAQITRTIASQKRLLASIHETIQKVVAEQAARIRREKELARERIEREVA